MVLTREADPELYPGTPSGLSGLSLHFQVGPNAHNSMFLYIPAISAQSLGLVDAQNAPVIDVTQSDGIDVSRQLNILDRALTQTSEARARLGAAENRLEFIGRSLVVTEENLSATESRIRNADMASEMMRFTQAQITQQMGLAVLAQANSVPNMVRRLLESVPI